MRSFSAEAMREALREARERNAEARRATSGRNEGAAVARGDDAAPVIPGGNGAQWSGDMAVDEIGGPEGPEPTRYGDWERKGRCYDF